MKYSHDAAVQTLVLLKNEGNTLPLTGSVLAKVAVLGPGGNTRDHPTYGPGVTSNATTVFTALQNRISASKVVFSEGCSGAACEAYNHSDVAQALQGATSAVVVLSGYEIENEGEISSEDVPHSVFSLFHGQAEIDRLSTFQDPRSNC